jgi:hypothetical protein
MSIYFCQECGYYKDNDWLPCEEDPRNPGELVCEDCLESIQDELNEENDDGPLPD